jgi:7,8-dihydropterin-6-yl-methyl-4-(beta-D-ribofuranosyl)aminobenzene 5'-phosphate synthase
MKRMTLLVVCMVCVSSILLGQSVKKEKVRCTVLFDNTAADTSYGCGWGFSCLFEGLEKNILFDTGADAEILRKNLVQAGKDMQHIELLVVSHLHGDHTKGMGTLLGSRNVRTVFMPQSWPFTASAQWPGTGWQVQVVAEPRQICRNVFLTGAMGDQIIEQSMIIDTPQGGILITGCAHPGIVDILRKAQKVINKDIVFVFGGFHLLKHTDQQIAAIVAEFKSMAVPYCGATHCTGDKAIAAFREAYGDHFVESGAGRVITWPMEK